MSKTLLKVDTEIANFTLCDTQYGILNETDQICYGPNVCCGARQHGEQTWRASLSP